MNEPTERQAADPAPTYWPPMMPYAPNEQSRWPAWRIADLVGTILLFLGYGAVLVVLLFFSAFWVMGTDSCPPSGCDYGKLDIAYTLNNVCGIIVYLVCLVIAVILLVMRKPAFWLPLIGGVIQIALLAAALGQLNGVNPT